MFKTPLVHPVVTWQVSRSHTSKPIPVKNASLLEHIAQVDVGVQEIGIQLHSLLKVVNGEPDLALGIEHTAQVAPGHGEAGLSLDGLQVTALKQRETCVRRRSLHSF